LRRARPPTGRSAPAQARADGVRGDGPPGRNQSGRALRTVSGSGQYPFSRPRRPSPELPLTPLDGGDQFRERIDGAIQTQEALEDAGEEEQAAPGETFLVEMERDLGSPAEGQRPIAPHRRHDAATLHPQDTVDLAARLGRIDDVVEL